MKFERPFCQLNINHQRLFVLFIITAGALLRLYTLCFFEFKGDQAKAITGGIAARDAWFLIDHGMSSSVGLPNLPGLYYFTGFLSFISSSPLSVAGIFVSISILTTILFWYFFKPILSEQTMILSLAFLSFSPSLITYSSNIWAQCLLPPICCAIFFCLTRHIENHGDWYWGLAAILMAFATSLHLSGPMLSSLLILGVLVKRPKWRVLCVSTFIIFILFLPYICFLFSSGSLELKKQASSFQNVATWIVKYFLEFHTLFFFRYYFSLDFMDVCTRYWGFIPAFLCLLLGSVVPLSAIFVALLRYLQIVFKYKKPLVFESEINMPILIQLAAFHLVLLLILSILLKIRFYPHYFLITVPAGFLLMGHSFSQIKHSLSRRLIVGASIIALASQTAFVLFYIDNSGGHPHEYGPHYGMLSHLRTELEILSEERKVKAEIQVIGRAGFKFDKSAIEHVLGSFLVEQNITPNVIIYLKWNEKKMAYVYQIEAL